MSTKSLFLLFVCLLSAAALPACGAAASSQIQLFEDPVLMKGKGFEVKRSELEASVTALQATLAAQGQNLPPSRVRELETNTLNRLVLTRIIVQMASPADKAKAKEEADKMIAAEKARANGEATMKRRLLVLGMTMEEFERKALEDKLVDIVIDREIKSQITVTPEQVQDFYEKGIDFEARELQGVVDKLAKEQPDSIFYRDGKLKLEELLERNKKRMIRPETVRAQHILVYTIDLLTKEPLSDKPLLEKRQRVEKLLARVKGGEDFTKVVLEASEDPEAKTTKGEYEVAAQANLAPELRSAIFSMGVNQISDIVATSYGLHIVKVLERTPAGRPPLAKLEKDLKEALLNQETLRRVPAFGEKIKKEYQVEVVTPLDR